MRTLLLLCTIAGCDPTWHVMNVATAQPSTKTDLACIEAGLNASGQPVKRNGLHAAPAQGWYVGSGVGTMRVAWDPKTPTKLELEAIGVGTAPPAGAPENY